MLKGIYTSRLVAANFTTRLWMLIGLSMMVVNGLLAAKIVTTNVTEKTILVPGGLSRPLWVQGETLSPQYIEEVARYFANLLLVYQKSTARAQFDEVLRFVSPEIYAQVKTELDREADRISRTQISSIFYLTGIHVVNHTAFVSGQTRAFVGATLAAEKEKIYQFDFAQGEGGLRITAFKEVRRNPAGGYEQISGSQNTQVPSS